MAVWWREYRKTLSERLALHRNRLSTLESGELRVGEQTVGDRSWHDVTAREVAKLKSTIAEFEGLVTRIDKDHPGENLDN